MKPAWNESSIPAAAFTKKKTINSPIIVRNEGECEKEHWNIINKMSRREKEKIP